MEQAEQAPSPDAARVRDLTLELVNFVPEAFHKVPVQDVIDAIRHPDQYKDNQKMEHVIRIAAAKMGLIPSLYSARF